MNAYRHRSRFWVLQTAILLLIATLGSLGCKSDGSDGDPILRGRSHTCSRAGIGMRRFLVGYEPLQLADGDGFVRVSTTTDVFAWMMAYPAADAREGIPLSVQRDRLVEAAFADQCHIPGNVDVGRTLVLTGSKHEIGAHTGGTFFAEDVRVVFVSEEPERR